jgi:uncharacterized protein YndB with AHSA1/START domain
MTGPDGDEPHGWRRVIAAERPAYLELEDGVADAQGQPDPAMPTMTARVTVRPQPEGGPQMTVETTFPSVEATDQPVAMGMEERMTAAVGGMDALLHADATSG